MVLVGDQSEQYGRSKPFIKGVLETHTGGLVNVVSKANKKTFWAVHLGNQAESSLKRLGETSTVLSNTRGGVRAGELLLPAKFFGRIAGLGVDVEKLLKKLAPSETPIRVPRPPQAPTAAQRASAPALVHLPHMERAGYTNATVERSFTNFKQRERDFRRSDVPAREPPPPLYVDDEHAALHFYCRTGELTCMTCQGSMHVMVSKYTLRSGFRDDANKSIVINPGEAFAKCNADYVNRRWGAEAVCPKLLFFRGEDELMAAWRANGKP